jgi:histidinol-phosphate aminotransferase
MSRPWFSHLVRTDLATVEAYVPHAGHFPVRLDANESPHLLSAEAQARVAEVLGSAALNRYPDVNAVELRQAIADRAKCSVDEVIAGSGSDEVIAILLSALDRPREKNPRARIVTTTPTFVMYRLSAKVRGIDVVEVPLDSAWNLDVSGLKRAIEFARPNIVFIATPNNPTGNCMAEDRLREVITAAPDTLFVLDEAYVDFSSTNVRHLRHEFPNVALLGTISKIGFAALRVGWLIGPRELVHELHKLRQPYNIPLPSQRAATFVLGQLQDEVARLVEHVVHERDRITGELERLGFKVVPSQTNFVWIATNRPATEVFDGLASQGILVRSFAKHGGRLAQRLRVTVGTQNENDRFLETIARLV